jgi:predicted DCC family thiol-disulfide oxidoreductase YuxK
MQDMKIDVNEIQTPLTVVYDGENSAISEEIRFLKSRNRDSKLIFVDLSVSAESGSEYGINPAAMKEKLVVHDTARHVFTGNKALYAAHSVIGLGSWFEMCRLPGFLSVGTGIRPKS